jgi:large conductance mechanosensitive channel
MKDFKDFLLRGNLVALAIAFVIGTAFAALLGSFIDNLIMPIVAAIIGKPDFSLLTFTIHHSVFGYGSFITALIYFVSVAAVIFFFVVKPYNAFTARTQKDVPPTDRECPHCLSAIPIAATVCAHCTREVGAAA